MQRIDLALAVAVALQLADFITTWGAIRRRGGREANPVVRWLMQLFGFVPGLTLAKTVGTVLAIWLWAIGAERELWALSVLYLVIVVNNTRVGR